MFSRYSYGSEYDVLFPSRFLRFIEFCVSGGSCSSAPLTGELCVKCYHTFLQIAILLKKFFSTTNRRRAGARRSYRRLPLQNALPVRRWCFLGAICSRRAPRRSGKRSCCKSPPVSRKRTSARRAPSRTPCLKDEVRQCPRVRSRAALHTNPAVATCCLARSCRSS